MYAYVGSRTTRERHARGEGISLFRVDADRGTLTRVDIERGLVNPSFLALSDDGRFLYTVHGDETEVSAFRIDPRTGRLQFINRQGTRGRNPVHLALDPTGRHLVVSNHLGGSVAVLPVNADGSLAPLSQLVTLEGPIGPHRVEQTQAKPHFNLFDPSGRFIVVPDKGLDRLFVFRFDNGQLQPAAEPFAVTRETAGPRHVVFHPEAALLYAVNELDSTVTAYRFDPDTGALTAFQLVSTLPDRYTGNSRASGIEIDRTGRFLYASNRGYDSIAVFAIDAASGRLSPVQIEPSLGRTPRFFALAPGGRHLFVLNEDSDDIITFTVDPATGRLAPTGARIASASPVCMVFSG